MEKIKTIAELRAFLGGKASGERVNFGGFYLDSGVLKSLKDISIVDSWNRLVFAYCNLENGLPNSQAIYQGEGFDSSSETRAIDYRFPTIIESGQRLNDGAITRFDHSASKSFLGRKILSLPFGEGDVSVYGYTKVVEPGFFNRAGTVERKVELYDLFGKKLGEQTKTSKIKDS